MSVEALFGPLPPHWTVTTLGAACARGGGSVQTGPFGSQLHASDYVAVGIPSIMPQNIGDNRINPTGIARIMLEDAARLSRYRLQVGDIVYSRRGDVERRALVREAEDGWLCGTGCLRVRFGLGYVDPSFASYYLAHPEVRAWVVRHAVGATMANLSTSLLAALPFIVPPLSEQQAIASVLSALDDKIELNRQMNHTLEAMAQALFQSWFVDFDPVRAKAEGRDPGLAKPVAGLFPDSFEESELGEIPKGWRVVPIGELVSVVGGTTPSTKETAFWSNGDHFWATPKDLSGLATPVLLRTERKITDAGLAQIGSGLLPPGTVLLSSRAPIGYLAVTEVPTAINQGFIAILPQEEISNLFILRWAEWAHDEIISRANGSTFLEISKAKFRPIPIIKPPRPVLGAFDQVVRPIYEHVVTNEREAHELATLRDTLLPKLISGELRVPEAEEMVSAAC